jgi:coenzyme A transferase
MRTVSVAEAIAKNSRWCERVMIGGFMGVGAPERLLDELVRQRKSNLFVIANDATVRCRHRGRRHRLDGDHQHHINKFAKATGDERRIHVDTEGTRITRRDHDRAWTAPALADPGLIREISG